MRYGLSYRDLEELLAERGIEVDHVTLYRWAQRFTPLLIHAAPARHLAGDRWFVDVLALQIAHLMRRRADQAGLHLSVRELLDDLAGIEETVLIYPSTGGRPKARRMLTETDARQDRLIEIFDLKALAPRP